MISNNFVENSVTYEHRPTKLQIVVDGQIRGVQSIAGSINNVQIKL